MPQHTLESIIQALQNPAQLEQVIDILANQMPPPPVDLPIPGQAGQGQIPGQGQQQQQVVQQPQAPAQGPNLGAAITGNDQIINPNVAQFLQQLKLGGK